jgi:RHS repeat-associated protein
MRPRNFVAAGAAFWTLLSGTAHAQTVEYYQLDALGNVRVITDANAAVLERHDYLPFGEECTTGACASNPGVGAGEAKKFTGKERDSETGLDYFGARYYGSKFGRFTTVDPTMNIKGSILNPQKWNRYAYVLNSPMRFVDPDGRQEGAALNQDRDIRALINGQISVAEYNARIEARAAGAVIGLAAAGGMIAPALATEASIAVGRCGVSAGCQNAIRGLAEGASAAPPGAMGTVPTLSATGNRAMFQEALGYLTGSKGSAAEKVQLFEGLAGQIAERSGGSWTATRGAATNAAGVWVGEGRPFGLAIDNAGKVWTTQNIHEGATFGASGSITIDFSKWTQR